MSSGKYARRRPRERSRPLGVARLRRDHRRLDRGERAHRLAAGASHHRQRPHRPPQIIGQIDDLKKEKASLPADATKERREQFDKQVKHLESLHASNNLLLRDEMGFEGDNPVDLADDPQLKSLRQKRDAEAYKRWTARVLSRVKATRGASAW